MSARKKMPNTDSTASNEAGANVSVSTSPTSKRA